MIQQIVEQVIQSRKLTPEVAAQLDNLMWNPDLSAQELEALQNLVYAISVGIVHCTEPVTALSYV